MLIRVCQLPFVFVRVVEAHASVFPMFRGVRNWSAKIFRAAPNPFLLKILSRWEIKGG